MKLTSVELGGGGGQEEGFQQSRAGGGEDRHESESQRQENCLETTPRDPRVCTMVSGTMTSVRSYACLSLSQRQTRKARNNMDGHLTLPLEGSKRSGTCCFLKLHEDTVAILGVQENNLAEP